MSEELFLNEACFDPSLFIVLTTFIFLEDYLSCYIDYFGTIFWAIFCVFKYSLNSIDFLFFT
jgi:hypothetical protein